jgi:DNA-binding response OmpR family regulator
VTPCACGDAENRVLIVEDDRAIRELVCDMLGSATIQCVCVKSDREAYSVIPTMPALRGLIVDVNLGAGTTGFDVARFARQVIPDLPVVYVSGHSSEQSFEAFGVPGSHFILKPFGADELIAKVRDVMRPAQS